MTKEEYQKLNDYLNDICIYLDNKDWILLNNIEVIARFNSAFRRTYKEYELKRDYQKNNLTFNEIYLLAREIIETINPKYLKDFDNLLSSGELEFDYDNELYDSVFMHIFNKENTFNLINIKRSFNYDDVITLIHEYMHYTNGKVNEEIDNHHILTEYVSIYFEMYAMDYLINKGVPKEELNYNDRIISVYNHGLDITDYELILLSYQKFGNINKNTYQDLTEHVLNISQEQFEEECKKFLTKCEKLDKEYHHEILYEREFNSKEYAQTLADNMTRNYRYLLGTILAIYTREFNDMDSVIKLNDKLNDEMVDLNDLLLLVHVDLNSNTLKEDLLNSLRRYIEKYDNKKVIK